MRNSQWHKQASWIVLYYSLTNKHECLLIFEFLLVIYRPGRMKGLVGISNCEVITYSRLLRVNYVTMPRFEPATYWSINRHVNHSATAPKASDTPDNFVLLSVESHVNSTNFFISWLFSKRIEHSANNGNAVLQLVKRHVDMICWFLACPAN